jgi:hypothetical protein
MSDNVVVCVKRKRCEDAQTSMFIMEEGSLQQEMSMLGKNIERRGLMLSRVGQMDVDLDYKEGDYEHIMKQMKPLDCDRRMSKRPRPAKLVPRRLEALGDLVMIDMSQIATEPQIEKKGKRGTKILDPSSRNLMALLMSSDVSTDVLARDMKESILSGADVNCQVPQTGATALLIAVDIGCYSLVSLLLQRGSQLDIHSTAGQTALQLAHERRGQFKQDIDRERIVLVLEESTRRQLREKESEDELRDVDYVVDVFRSTRNCEQEAVTALEQETAPQVRVPGLRISEQEDGMHCAIAFEYDSDWSDLADDEEPDSNDERYAGNDYPDEEEGLYEDDDLLEYDLSGGEGEHSEDVTLEQKMARFKAKYETLGYLPGNRTGQVIRSSAGVAGTADYDPGQCTEIQLGDQRASPKEFKFCGLPKYGMDLSDVEDTDLYQHTDKPAPLTIPFDYELDMSD